MTQDQAKKEKQPQPKPKTKSKGKIPCIGRKQDRLEVVKIRQRSAIASDLPVHRTIYWIQCCRQTAFFGNMGTPNMEAYVRSSIR